MRSQKQMIYEVICASCEHMTADQIYLAAKKEHPSVAMGTVYRNLTLLAEEGLIRRVEIAGAPTHFDKNVSPHEHFVCCRCGRVRDSNLREDLLSFLRERTGADVRSYQLSIVELCPACRVKE